MNYIRVEAKRNMESLLRRGNVDPRFPGPRTRRGCFSSRSIVIFCTELERQLLMFIWYIGITVITDFFVDAAPRLQT